VLLTCKFFVQELNNKVANRSRTYFFIHVVAYIETKINKLSKSVFQCTFDVHSGVGCGDTANGEQSAFQFMFDVHNVNVCEDTNIGEKFTLDTNICKAEDLL